MAQNNSIRPTVRTFNSWDSTRYSQRQSATIATVIASNDAFLSGPSLESQRDTRRPSAVSIHVDESNPQTTPILYRLGWRSLLQIWAAMATTTTLGIAVSNLINRLHGER